MSNETLYVATDDGWTLALHLYPGFGPKRRHPVVMVHGMGANRLHFDLNERHSLARAAQARGFDTWVVELRGAGLTLAPGGRSRSLYQWGFADYAERDMPTAVSYVLERSGSRQVHAVGHSLGGMLCYHLATAAPAQLRSVTTVGSPLASHLALGGRERRVLQLAASLGPVTTFTPTPQRRVPLRRVLGAAAMFGAWSTRLVDNFALNAANCEPQTLAQLAREGIDDVPIRLVADLAYAQGQRGSSSLFAYEERLGTLLAPVLVMGGSVDRIATPASVGEAVARMGGPDVRWRQLGRVHGDAHDYGHVDLIIGRSAPEEVYLPIVDFLLEHDLAEADTLVA